MAVTKQQVRVHMLKRELGHTQITAAAKADFSERTGRRIEQGETSPSLPKPCHWRTRADPFEGVWEPELRVLLEANPGLRQTPLFKGRKDAIRGSYPDKHRRTWNGGGGHWWGAHGSVGEGMFPQVGHARVVR